MQYYQKRKKIKQNKNIIKGTTIAPAVKFDPVFYFCLNFLLIVPNKYKNENKRFICVFCFVFAILKV